MRRNVSHETILVGSLTFPVTLRASPSVFLGQRDEILLIYTADILEGNKKKKRRKGRKKERLGFRKEKKVRGFLSIES